MIEIKNLCIKLGNFTMKNIILKINTGEYFVILGPTGCGKTILLECLAGIRKPDSGEIWLDSRNVTDQFPEERNIGYLPQDFALFPHMSVEENIAFGMKARKMARNHIRLTVKNLADTLGITGLLLRRIQGLSGGERQRVALARALATGPKVVFLDEPLSALDEDTREKLATELRNIHDRFGTTFVHISHNLEEVAQVTDRVALMNRGCVEQVGTVNEIMKYPLSRYAAEFTRTKNIFEGCAGLRDNGHTAVSLGNGVSLISSISHTGSVLVTIRPESICVSDKPFGISENAYKGKVVKAYYRGVLTRIDIDIGIVVSAYAPNQSAGWKGLNDNGDIFIHIPPDAVHLIAG